MARDVSEETRAKWRRVLNGLHTATVEQKITWDRTAIETAFVTALGSHVILFERLEDDRKVTYVIKLQDLFGELVDEFDDTDLDVGLFDNVFLEKMDALHLKIKRQMSGADSAIDEVLTELDKLDDIPF